MHSPATTAACVIALRSLRKNSPAASPQATIPKPCTHTYKHRHTHEHMESQRERGREWKDKEARVRGKRGENRRREIHRRERNEEEGAGLEGGSKEDEIQKRRHGRNRTARCGDDETSIHSCIMQIAHHSKECETWVVQGRREAPPECTCQRPLAL